MSDQWQVDHKTLCISVEIDGSSDCANPKRCAVIGQSAKASFLGCETQEQRSKHSVDLLVIFFALPS